MAERLILESPVECKPLSEWGPVSVELLGTQTRIVQGPRWSHRVIEAGEGEPLLLYHGIGGHAETWARNLHNLGRNFHVFAVDSLFHGYSSKDGWDSDRWIEIQADGVADLLDGLGLDGAHIEGESLGAQIAFDFAVRYPDRIRKLVLNTGLVEVADPQADDAEVDAEPENAEAARLKALSDKVVSEPSFDSMRKRLEWLVHGPERMTDEMVQIRLRIYEDPDVNASMRRVYRVGESWKMAWQKVDASTIDRLTADTLVFWTEHNPGTGPDVGERFADLLPKARFYNMLDAAHWPQWEKPEEHDQVILEFTRT